MNKSKTILAVLMSFQTSNYLIGAENLQLVHSSVMQDSQIIELLNTLKSLQSKIVTKWVQFLDKENYPDMSLDELGNEIIELLNTYGKNLPQDIRQNLIEIVEIKKRSTNIIQFRSGHVLINDTMILLVDTLLAHLHHETANIINMGVPTKDINTVKRALSAMRKSFDDLKRDGDYAGIETTIYKLTALTKQLEPIFLTQLKRNKIDLSNNNTPSIPKLSGTMLLMLISYRISKNK